MNFTLTYSSHKELVTKWITIYNGMLGLSERQKELVVEIVTRYLELREVILDEEVLWTTLLSTSERKKYRESLGNMSPYQFTNLLSDLRKAQVLVHLGGVERIEPKLLPEPTFQVTFLYK